MRARFFGLATANRRPTARARPGARESTAVIHTGGPRSDPRTTHRRQVRAASARSTNPSTRASPDNAEPAARPVSVRWPRRVAAASTSAMPVSQPARKPALVPLGRPASRITRPAATGTGLIDTPTAGTSTCPIAGSTTAFRAEPRSPAVRVLHTSRSGAGPATGNSGRSRQVEVCPVGAGAGAAAAAACSAARAWASAFAL